MKWERLPKPSQSFFYESSLARHCFSSVCFIAFSPC